MDLASRQCQGSASLLANETIGDYMKAIDSRWQLASDNSYIKRSFEFSNYYETMAFANVVAMVAHQQDHHPDMTIKYNRCVVQYSTHSVGGLSEYDFICAAKIDATLPI